MPLRTGRGPIAFEGVTTGDGRLIAPGALRWDAGPWPFAWTPEDWGGHQGAIDVGAMSAIAREGAAIVADYGVDPGAEAGAEVIRQYGAGIPLGISVDLDDVTVELVDMTLDEEDADVEAGPDDDEDLSLAAAALARPAAARFHVDHMTFTFTLNALTADGVVVAEWSAGDLIERVVDARIRRATLCSTPAFADAIFVLDDAEDEAGDPAAEEAPEPVAAAGRRRTSCRCAGTCSSCRGVVSVDELRTSLGLPAQPVTAAGAGRAMFSSPRLPPPDRFNDPGFSAPTPLDISEAGVVFGHVATWDTCHTGSPVGECIRPPRSPSRYAYFRTGSRPTTTGRVAVGQLTVGGGHADLQLSYRAAAEHYDNAAAAVADVAAGEDSVGIWVAGVLRPGVDDDQVLALLASSLSGDWRAVGGYLEMIAAHGVNVPGFPIARIASGAAVALVAAGSLPPRVPPSAPPDLAEIIAQGIETYEARRTAREAAPHRARLARLATDHHRDRLRRLGA